MQEMRNKETKDGRTKLRVRAGWATFCLKRRIDDVHARQSILRVRFVAGRQATKKVLSRGLLSTAIEQTQPEIALLGLRLQPPTSGAMGTRTWGRRVGGQREERGLAGQTRWKEAKCAKRSYFGDANACVGTRCEQTRVSCSSFVNLCRETSFGSVLLRLCSYGARGCAALQARTIFCRDWLRERKSHLYETLPSSEAGNKARRVVAGTNDQRRLAAVKWKSERAAKGSEAKPTSRLSWHAQRSTSMVTACAEILDSVSAGQIWLGVAWPGRRGTRRASKWASHEVHPCCSPACSPHLRLCLRARRGARMPWRKGTTSNHPTEP